MILPNKENYKGNYRNNICLKIENKKQIDISIKEDQEEKNHFFDTKRYYYFNKVVDFIFYF